MVCPSENCGEVVSSSTSYLVEYNNDEGIVTYQGNPVSHWKLSPKLDALRIWMTDDTQFLDRSGVIAFAYKASERIVNLYKIRFDTKIGIHIPDRETTLKLFAKFLHPLLFNDELSDKEAGLPDPKDCGMREFLGLAFQDESLAFPCLYALSTGKIKSRDDIKAIEKGDSAAHQSLYRAVFVAKELLMYPDGKRRKVSRWQKFFVEMIYAHVGEGGQKVIEVLSKFRVSASTSYQDSLLGKKIVAAVKDNQLFLNVQSKWCFHIFSLDNLDFKIKGPHPGNDPWVVMTIHCVTLEELRKLGFYAMDPARRISRERRTLEELTQDGNGDVLENAEELITQVRDNEWEQFSFCVLQHIATVMKLWLPNLNEAQEMTDDNVVDWEEYNDIPRHLGIDLLLPTEPNVVDGVRVPSFPRKCDPFDAGELANEIADDEEEEVEIAETLVSRNNVTVDIPLNEDLKKLTVVQKYMMTILDMAETIRNFDDNGDLNVDEYGGEEPVQSLMVPMCGDGSPSAAGLKILDVAVIDDRARDFEGLRLFSGCFHWTIELIGKRADLAVDIVKFFTRQYRPTETQQKHVMFPSDPRQAVEEAPYYLAGHYRAAADEFASINARTLASSPEVNAHMVARAKEYSLAMEVLQDLRRLELLVLFRDIEKTSSADLLIATLWIVLAYLMVSNAHNYIRITVDTLVWWETTSEAEKNIFERFILTRRTAAGKPVFLDRLQEMFNTVFRFKCGGKIWHRGLDKKILSTALDLGTIQAQKKAASSFRDRKERRRAQEQSTTEQLRKVYLHTYVTARRINLWGIGPIRIGVKGDERDAMPNLLEVPGAKPGQGWCDAAALRAYPTGVHRVLKYVRNFCLLHPNHPERPIVGALGVAIQKIGLSQEKLKARQDAILALRTSLKATKIARWLSEVKVVERNQ